MDSTYRVSDNCDSVEDIETISSAVCWLRQWLCILKSRFHYRFVYDKPEDNEGNVCVIYPSLIYRMHLSAWSSKATARCRVINPCCAHCYLRLLIIILFANKTVNFAVINRSNEWQRLQFADWKIQRVLASLEFWRLVLIKTAQKELHCAGDKANYWERV